MERIWFFGDCFTWGYQCRPKFTYYHKYKQDGDKIWTDIVSETLGYKKEDKSIRAFGTNFETIKIFIESLSNIKEGDIVIYGTSKPYGVLKLNNRKTRLCSLSGLSEYDIESDKLWRDEVDKKIGLDYLNLNVCGYELQWMNFFIPQIKNLAQILLEKNIKTYLWSYELYDNEDRFESISTATNKDIEDYHFSFKGHRQMAEYILDLIKNDKYITKDLI